MRESKPAKPDVELGPRFWWIKRIALGYLMLMVLGPAAYWAWGWYARHTLLQMIDAAHARGDPILPEDFDKQVPQLDPAVNATIHFERAAAAVKGYETLIRYVPYGRFGTVDLNACQRMLEGNSRPLNEARLAADLQGGMGSVPPSDLIRHFRESDFPQLSRLLQAAAIVDHATGDDDLAIKDIETDVRLSEVARFQCNFGGYFNGLGIENDCNAILSNIFRDLSSTQNLRAKPESLRNAIALLGDETARRQGVRLCYLGLASEELFVNDRMADLRPEQSWLAHTPVGPLTRVYNGLGFQVLAEPSLAIAGNLRRNAKDTASILTGASRATTVWENDNFSSIDAIHIAFRRLEATALAISLWKSSHPDQPFTALSQLVPDCLAAIPEDPFSNKSIRYRLANGVACIYCVGPNQKDDDGGNDDESLDLNHN